MVEFAFAALFAIILLFAICDFGRAIFAYDLVANASRIGSRYAIVRGSTCAVSGCPASVASISSYVLSRSPGLNTGSLVVLTTWGPASCGASPYNEPGCSVTVKVNYSFKFLFLTKIPPVPMTDQSTMVISQ